MQLHFIKFYYVITSDKWNTCNFLYPCVYFLKRNTKDLGTCPAIVYRPSMLEQQRLDHRSFRGQSSFLISIMTPKWAAKCLDSSLHASKVAKLAPLFAAIPKKLSKSEAVTSGPTNFDKHIERRRQPFSTLVF